MTKKKNIQARLSLMMFMQYMMFAVWWVPLAAYLSKLGIDGSLNALILSSMAIGCMASPVIGMIADRYFPSEKVLMFLNLSNAILLLLAGFTGNPYILFLLLLVAMILYMPSWGLTSSIAMAHAPSEIFPKIRVFGSIGWVVSGGFSLIMVKLFDVSFDGTNIPFFFAAAISVCASALNLFLPETPPVSRRQKTSFIDLFGLRALKYMSDRNFAIFIILSFLSMIPFSMYWSYCSEFLFDQRFKYITITMNLGQLAEMLLILTVPLAIKKGGIRLTLTIGLIALFVRYLAFYLGAHIGLSFLFFVGILVHGVIFGYFYLGGQIFIDKRLPAEFRSQAQGFIFLITFGIGLLIGNFISRRIIETYTTTVNNVKVYDWSIIWGITAITSFCLLFAFIFLFRNVRKSATITIAPLLLMKHEKI